jgi:hypothetical protein
MLRRGKVILSTVLVWPLVVVGYCYFWTKSIMADPAQHDYEGIWILPVLGFVMYRLPYLLLALLLITALQLLFIREKSG